MAFNLLKKPYLSKLFCKKNPPIFYYKSKFHCSTVHTPILSTLQKQYPLPATVYSTSEGGPAHLWDQPLPIWTSAASAPSSVWDPLYLHDPRYVQPSSLPVPAHQGIPAYYRSPGTRSIGSSR